MTRSRVKVSKIDGRRYRYPYPIYYRPPLRWIMPSYTARKVTVVARNFGPQIMRAIRHNDLEYLQRILEFRLRDDFLITKLCTMDISHKIASKQVPCPLIVAAQMKDPTILQYILDKGTDPNYLECKTLNMYRYCALHAAVRRGIVETTLTLLNARADPNVADSRGDSPLHIAVRAGNCALAKLLLSHRADVNMKDRYGNAPLHIAIRQGHSEMVRLLLEYGADVRMPNRRGMLPIHVAANCGHAHLLKILCDADATIADATCVIKGVKQAPLHLAAEHGHVDVVNLLLGLNVDVNAKDSEGNTALHRLLLTPYQPNTMRDLNHFYATAIAFIQARIEVNKENNLGQTPLMLASANGFPKVAELIHLGERKEFRVDSENVQQILKQLDILPSRGQQTKMVGKENDAATGLDASTVTSTNKNESSDDKKGVIRDQKQETITTNVKPQKVEESHLVKDSNQLPKIDNVKRYPMPTSDLRNYQLFRSSPVQENEILTFKVAENKGAERMSILFDKTSPGIKKSSLLKKEVEQDSKSFGQKEKLSGVDKSSIQKSRESPVRATEQKKADSLELPAWNSKQSQLVKGKEDPKANVKDSKESGFYGSLAEKSLDPTREVFYGEDESGWIDHRVERDTSISPVTLRDIRRTTGYSSRHYSKSPSGFLSEGGGFRQLRLRVTGEVPKAYTSKQKDAARKAFILAQPVGIESTGDNDRTRLSMMSLPEIGGQAWEKAMQRRIEWTEPLKPVYKKQPAEREFSPSNVAKDLTQDRLRRKNEYLIAGLCPLPYKSFGKIETKTDAIEEALLDEESEREFESDDDVEPITNEWVSKVSQRQWKPVVPVLDGRPHGDVKRTNYMDVSLNDSFSSVEAEEITGRILEEINSMADDDATKLNEVTKAYNDVRGASPYEIKPKQRDEVRGAPISQSIPTSEKPNSMGLLNLLHGYPARRQGYERSTMVVSSVEPEIQRLTFENLITANSDSSDDEDDEDDDEEMFEEAAENFPEQINNVSSVKEMQVNVKKSQGRIDEDITVKAAPLEQTDREIEEILKSKEKSTDVLPSKAALSSERPSKIPRKQSQKQESSLRNGTNIGEDEHGRPTLKDQRKDSSKETEINRERKELRQNEDKVEIQDEELPPTEPKKKSKKAKELLKNKMAQGEDLDHEVEIENQNAGEIAKLQAVKQKKPKRKMNEQEADKVTRGNNQENVRQSQERKKSAGEQDFVVEEMTYDVYTDEPVGRRRSQKEKTRDSSLDAQEQQPTDVKELDAVADKIAEPGKRRKKQNREEKEGLGEIMILADETQVSEILTEKVLPKLKKPHSESPKPVNGSVEFGEHYAEEPGSARRKPMKEEGATRSDKHEIQPEQNIELRNEQDDGINLAVQKVKKKKSKQKREENFINDSAEQVREGMGETVKDDQVTSELRVDSDLPENSGKPQSKSVARNTDSAGVVQISEVNENESEILQSAGPVIVVEKPEQKKKKKKKEKPETGTEQQVQDFIYHDSMSTDDGTKESSEAFVGKDVGFVNDINQSLISGTDVVKPVRSKESKEKKSKKSSGKKLAPKDDWSKSSSISAEVWEEAMKDEPLASSETVYDVMHLPNPKIQQINQTSSMGNANTVPQANFEWIGRVEDDHQKERGAPIVPSVVHPVRTVKETDIDDELAAWEQYANTLDDAQNAEITASLGGKKSKKTIRKIIETSVDDIMDDIPVKKMETSVDDIMDDDIPVRKMETSVDDIMDDDVPVRKMETSVDDIMDDDVPVRTIETSVDDIMDDEPEIFAIRVAAIYDASNAVNLPPSSGDRPLFESVQLAGKGHLETNIDGEFDELPAYPEHKPSDFDSMERNLETNIDEFIEESSVAVSKDSSWGDVEMLNRLNSVESRASKVTNIDDYHVEAAAPVKLKQRKNRDGKVKVIPDEQNDESVAQTSVGEVLIEAEQIKSRDKSGRKKKSQKKSRAEETNVDENFANSQESEELRNGDVHVVSTEDRIEEILEEPVPAVEGKARKSKKKLRDADGKSMKEAKSDEKVPNKKVLRDRNLDILESELADSESKAREIVQDVYKHVEDAVTLDAAEDSDDIKVVKQSIPKFKAKRFGEDSGPSDESRENLQTEIEKQTPTFSLENKTARKKDERIRPEKSKELNEVEAGPVDDVSEFQRRKKTKKQSKLHMESGYDVSAADKKAADEGNFMVEEEGKHDKQEIVVAEEFGVVKSSVKTKKQVRETDLVEDEKIEDHRNKKSRRAKEKLPAVVTDEKKLSHSDHTEDDDMEKKIMTSKTTSNIQKMKEKEVTKKVKETDFMEDEDVEDHKSKRSSRIKEEPSARVTDQKKISHSDHTDEDDDDEEKDSMAPKTFTIGASKTQKKKEKEVTKKVKETDFMEDEDVEDRKNKISSQLKEKPHARVTPEEDLSYSDHTHVDDDIKIDNAAPKTFNLGVSNIQKKKDKEVKKKVKETDFMEDEEVEDLKNKKSSRVKEKPHSRVTDPKKFSHSDHTDEDDDDEEKDITAPKTFTIGASKVQKNKDTEETKKVKKSDFMEDEEFEDHRNKKSSRVKEKSHPRVTDEKKFSHSDHTDEDDDDMEEDITAPKTFNIGAGKIQKKKEKEVTKKVKETDFMEDEDVEDRQNKKSSRLKEKPRARVTPEEDLSYSDHFDDDDEMEKDSAAPKTFNIRASDIQKKKEKEVTKKSVEDDLGEEFQRRKKVKKHKGKEPDLDEENLKDAAAMKMVESFEMQEDEKKRSEEFAVAKENQSTDEEEDLDELPISRDQKKRFEIEEFEEESDDSDESYEDAQEEIAYPPKMVSFGGVGSGKFYDRIHLSTVMEEGSIKEQKKMKEHDASEENEESELDEETSAEKLKHVKAEETEELSDDEDAYRVVPKIQYQVKKFKDLSSSEANSEDDSQAVESLHQTVPGKKTDLGKGAEVDTSRVDKHAKHKTKGVEVTDEDEYSDEESADEFELPRSKSKENKSGVKNAQNSEDVQRKKLPGKGIFKAVNAEQERDEDDDEESEEETGEKITDEDLSLGEVESEEIETAYDRKKATSSKVHHAAVRFGEESDQSDQSDDDDDVRKDIKAPKTFNLGVRNIKKKHGNEVEKTEIESEEVETSYDRKKPMSTKAHHPTIRIGEESDQSDQSDDDDVQKDTETSKTFNIGVKATEKKQTNNVAKIMNKENLPDPDFGEEFQRRKKTKKHTELEENERVTSNKKRVEASNGKGRQNFTSADVKLKDRPLSETNIDDASETEEDDRWVTPKIETALSKQKRLHEDDDDEYLNEEDGVLSEDVSSFMNIDMARNQKNARVSKAGGRRTEMSTDENVGLKTATQQKLQGKKSLDSDESDEKFQSFGRNQLGRVTRGRGKKETRNVAIENEGSADGDVEGDSEDSRLRAKTAAKTKKWQTEETEETTISVEHAKKNHTSTPKTNDIDKQKTDYSQKSSQPPVSPLTTTDESQEIREKTARSVDKTQEDAPKSKDFDINENIRMKRRMEMSETTTTTTRQAWKTVADSRSSEKPMGENSPSLPNVPGLRPPQKREIKPLNFPSTSAAQDTTVSEMEPLPSVPPVSMMQEATFELEPSPVSKRVLNRSLPEKLSSRRDDSFNRNSMDASLLRTSTTDRSIEHRTQRQHSADATGRQHQRPRSTDFDTKQTPSNTNVRRSRRHSSRSSSLGRLDSSSRHSGLIRTHYNGLYRTQKQVPIKSVSGKQTDKTLQEAAFETITASTVNERHLLKKKLIPDSEKPIVYTRGIYRPQPVYWRGSGHGGGNTNDESRMSNHPPMVEHVGFDESYAAIDDATANKTTDSLEKSKTNGTNESLLSSPPQLSLSRDGQDDSVNRSSAFVAYNKRVTINEDERRHQSMLYGRRRHRHHRMSRTAPEENYRPPKITEPSAVDFNKYGMLAQLWMEQVDMKTVLKSKTMYLTIMPAGSQLPDEIARSIKYVPTGDDLTLPAQWVIAKGRSIRQQKRQLDHMRMSDAFNLSGGDSDPDLSRSARPMSPGRQSVLFFKVGGRWPELAWVLFEGIQTDAATVRMIKDIQLKNPSKLTDQIQDMMGRWWKQKGQAATIEELRRSLELINLPYVQDETFNPGLTNPFFSTSDADKKLTCEEVDSGDPEVSRMIHEYENRSHNASFNAEHRESPLSAQPFTSNALLRQMQQKGLETHSSPNLRNSRAKSGARESQDDSTVMHNNSRDASLLRVQSRNESVRLFSSQDSLNAENAADDRRSFAIVQPKTKSQKGKKFRHESNL